MRLRIIVTATLLLIITVSGITTFGVRAEGGTGKVLGIHYYSLRQGIEMAEFERFIREEWFPSVNVVPGIRLMIMKGDRGENVGKYLLVFEIDSIYARDYYFPEPNQPSEAFKSAQARCGERCEQVWNKFGSMVERSEYTDYVQLVGR